MADISFKTAELLYKGIHFQGFFKNQASCALSFVFDLTFRYDQAGMVELQTHGLCTLNRIATLRQSILGLALPKQVWWHRLISIGLTRARFCEGWPVYHGIRPQMTKQTTTVPKYHLFIC